MRTKQPVVRLASTVLLIVVFLLAAVATGSGTEHYKRTVEKYAIPDVSLINQDRQTVRLQDFLKSDKPILLDFIYGTCTTICPVLSAGFANFQRRLGEKAKETRLVSISIDPEHDTPEVMAEYLERYQRQPGWEFFTGTREDIDKVMRAFDAYVSNKMNHYPITFILPPGSDEWVRIYGLLGTSDLMKEYQNLLEQ